jgi:hypothetical protein
MESSLRGFGGSWKYSTSIRVNIGEKLRHYFLRGCESQFAEGFEVELAGREKIGKEVKRC